VSQGADCLRGRRLLQLWPGVLHLRAESILCSNRIEVLREHRLWLDPAMLQDEFDPVLCGQQ